MVLKGMFEYRLMVPKALRLLGEDNGQKVSILQMETCANKDQYRGVLFSNGNWCGIGQSSYQRMIQDSHFFQRVGRIIKVLYVGHFYQPEAESEIVR